MPEKALIEFMLDPGSYPEKPGSVSLVQTHISLVFIGDAFVYKVKKPLRFDFLDFTTLERRKFFIEEELRLNRRFSPDVYLAVMPISKKGGSFVIGDDSNILEYALKMRRISEDHMLYRLLAEGRVHREDLKRVGIHLAKLYGKIPSNEKARAFGSPEVIYHNLMENFEQTYRYIGGPVSEEAFEAITKWSLSFLKDRSAVFEERAFRGHIRECHGDLHLEHICMHGQDIYVFDCIEFNERFRFCDVASDVAFLAMDLDYNSRADLADAFVQAYVRASGDRGMMGVLTFYKVYRAYVRAKVTSFMLDDAGLEGDSKREAFETAKRYYDLALGYVSHHED